MLSINDADDMRVIFFNKSIFGKWISSFRRFKERKIQTIKFTNTEDKIIPTTPKLNGERFPKLLIGAPIKNFGNLSPYNFGVVGIILSSVIVNFIVCIFLSFNLRNENIILPNLELLRKISLMSLAAFIDCTLSFTILKTTNNFNSIFAEFLLLIFGTLTFFVIYFLLTKFLKVNKFKVLKKEI